jgi:hypothetical protein
MSTCGATYGIGQSSTDLHLGVLAATSFVILKIRKTNKIIAGTNLRFIVIFFFFFICITDRIQFDQFIVYKIS